MFFCHTNNNITKAINNKNKVINKRKGGYYNNCGEETPRKHLAYKRGPLICLFINLNNLTQCFCSISITQKTLTYFLLKFRKLDDLIIDPGREFQLFGP